MCAVDFGCLSVVDRSGNVDTGCTRIPDDSREETSVSPYIKQCKMLKWWCFSKKMYNSCLTGVFYPPVDMSMLT